MWQARNLCPERSRAKMKRAAARPGSGVTADNGGAMQTTWMMLGLAGLLSVPAQAQTISNSLTSEVVSVRECQPPADAKEAQVLAFDQTSLEAKLAVSVGKGEFKVT